MNSKKQTFIVSLIFIVIISIPFTIIGMEYKFEYESTQKEIDGIQEISNIHNLNIILKSIRGLNQLEKSLIKPLKKTLSISDKKVLQTIENLKNKNIAETYNKLISRETLSNEESFKQYTYLLKLFDQERFNIADNAQLLFESDRETYFLMTIAVLNIPDSIENIGRIRAIGSKILSKNIMTTKDKFLLQTNTQVFLNHIDEIEFILSKLSLKDSTKLKILIKPIIAEFYTIENIINNFENTTSEITSQVYFLQTTKLINNINNLFISSTDILNTKLHERINLLNKKILLGFALYIFILLTIIIATYVNYCKLSKEENLLNSKKNNNNFKNLLMEKYRKHLTLNQVCDQSLNSVINHFNAINGSLYLFDKENKKLYLGSTYGIKKDSIQQTLDLHENAISENILEKKMKITKINQKVNLGNISINSSTLVTVPILGFEGSIGTIQLLFDDKFKKIDIDFLQEMVSFIAGYIFKAQKDNETMRYLKLIDKNILISNTDLDGNILEVSEELCNLTQYSKDELIGQNHNIFKHKDTPKQIFSDMWKTITSGQTWRGELRATKKDGSHFWQNATITPDRDINDNIIGYTAIRVNITNQKAIEKIAITDELTALFNRRHFETIFSTQLKINQRAKGFLAFLLIDIDYFKQYNDTYGHQDGDTALKVVANTLRNSLKRPDDYTFRLGGEEFGSLYHIKNQEDGLRIANKLKENIESLHIEHINNSASKYVTISSGLYIISPQSKQTKEYIYKKADEALYKAKNNGRNQVCFV